MARNPTAVVTGGSQGFGLALTRSLAADGWTVVIDARRADRLAAAVESLGPAAARVIAIPGDINDPFHLDALAEAAGDVDLLVNNASTLGPLPMRRLADLDPDRFRAIFDTNVAAPLALIQRLLPSLRTRRGAIVNVTSDAAVEGYETWGGYGSTKAALEQLSNVLAAEEPDLRVWWIDPGDMRTEMHQDAFPGEDISDRPEPTSVVPAFRRLLKHRPPSGRIRLRDLEQVAA
jgi:NAD(P)-dependent dehydrogenase (short-subunit alcohol dehydrogenase family)